MTDSGKLDFILTEIKDMKQDIHGMKEDIHGLKETVDGTEEKVQGMEEKVQGMEVDIQGLKQDMQEVKDSVKMTNLIMENEIRVNIQRVAEGHLDLSRNLHEAMKPSKEVELLSVKVRTLESDVGKLKGKFA